MRKERLIYRLVPFERALVFQILHQDKELTDYCTPLFIKTASGIQVKSEATPELSDRGKIVYLRGRDPTADFKISVLQFSNNEERNTAEANIHAALIEVVKMVEYTNQEIAVIQEPFVIKLSA